VTFTGIIIFIIVGVLAGWLAGLIWKRRGFGFPGNLALGVVGSFLGGYLFGLFDVHFRGFIGSTVSALIGALILLYVVSLIKK